VKSPYFSGRREALQLSLTGNKKALKGSAARIAQSLSFQMHSHVDGDLSGDKFLNFGLKGAAVFCTPQDIFAHFKRKIRHNYPFAWAKSSVCVKWCAFDRSPGVTDPLGDNRKVSSEVKVDDSLKKRA
jgi:hypothetical protein